MTAHERTVLEGVRGEYATCKRLLIEASATDRSNLEISATATHLESTYLLRAYAGFEDLLRLRTMDLRMRATLSTHIDSLLAGKVQGTFDPGRGYASQIRWSELFRRDRNALMHGRTLAPAMGFDVTLNTMQQLLRLL